jgi:hypothetical protein
MKHSKSRAPAPGPTSKSILELSALKARKFFLNGSSHPTISLDAVRRRMRVAPRGAPQWQGSIWPGCWQANPRAMESCRTGFRNHDVTKPRTSPDKRRKFAGLRVSSQNCLLMRAAMICVIPCHLTWIYVLFESIGSLDPYPGGGSMEWFS